MDPSCRPPPPPPPPPPPYKSWSIYGRGDIASRYRVLHRLGSGAYADVYRGVRIADGVPVALKEVHDRNSALREIEALQLLRGAPNVVQLLDYYSWSEGEDAVLVLELLYTDLASVVEEAKRSCRGLEAGEVKGWMVQVLRGLEACHEKGVVHRDLKPWNLLISSQGLLKLADFGQARVLPDPRFSSGDGRQYEEGGSREPWISQQPSILPGDNAQAVFASQSVLGTKATIHEDEYYREVVELKAKHRMDETVSLQDGDTSCLATCSTGDLDEDPLQSNYSFESYDGESEGSGALTSCVGTRWFRAPELLYGSTNYGREIDLWSLGCILAELFSLEPLFPGASDIDQLGRIVSTLGNISEEIWPGCSKLPDFDKISFDNVESPSGLASCLPNRSASEVQLIGKLVCYDPSSRATATELLRDRYFMEEPLPIAPSELKVPPKSEQQEESSPEEWGDYRDMESDSDEEFGCMDISRTEKGFSIKFSH